jgi:hypothetical protein
MRWMFLFMLCGSVAAQTLPPTGSFVYIDQIGSYNTTYVVQDTSEKKAMIINTGDSNDLTIYQTGSGNHIASISPILGNTTSANSSNLLSILQSGAGNHTASILFSNGAANSNNTASITQSGGAGADKQFTLQLNGSGIGAKVTQDNPTTPDSSSMAITCLAPPCTGYSYIKH